MLGKTGHNQNWLDCACGSGYATNFLTNFADFVTGYDIDRNAVEYATKNYKNNDCEFVSDILKYDKHFDVILSVETIEHMTKSDALVFLGSLRKGVKDTGRMIITTPIVKQTNNNPVNEFHFIEYSDEDFKSLLNSQGFKVLETNFIETKFTDGETKDQGYYKCEKIR